jgi:hypothetical protein
MPPDGQRGNCGAAIACFAAGACAASGLAFCDEVRLQALKSRNEQAIVRVRVRKRSSRLSRVPKASSKGSG